MISGIGMPSLFVAVRCFLGAGREVVLLAMVWIKLFMIVIERWDGGGGFVDYYLSSSRHKVGIVVTFQKFAELRESSAITILANISRH